MQQLVDFVCSPAGKFTNYFKIFFEYCCVAVLSAKYSVFFIKILFVKNLILQIFVF